jgi:2-succinyl-6-hydroxy-2,4-cyclohexadiene-1-carboxylate synthase
VLHVERWGKGPPVVALHGFTQSARAWGPFGQHLGTGHEVLGVDAPGHGRSASVRADLPRGADLIAATGGSAAYLGYSMGGRFALHVALRHPHLVRRLVLLSASAGIDHPGERATRRQADEALATQVERDGVAAFVAWWLDRPLFATLPPEAAAVDARLESTAAGLASSLRLAGTGTQEPLWDRIHELEMPVLILAGALDVAYAQRAERMASCIGANANVAVIGGAGHACHLERPDACWAAVGPFLSED